ncbi:MAG: hypothetical protein ACT4OP_11725 [Actinomycetota bacterium]
MTQETVPFTGLSTGTFGLIALTLAGAGGIFLTASRRVEEKNVVRSWN